MAQERIFDVVILGAGAAGLMCAIEAGKRGRRVAVLERAEKPGNKILISGGGRCNFTNLHCKAENFLSKNPHFARSALARYTPQEFIALVEKHGIAYHEKTLGQLFCDRSAAEILNMLLQECAAAGVEIVCKCSVLRAQCSEKAISSQPSAISKRSAQANGPRFVIETAQHGALLAEALVVATGGLSIPKVGATAFGYELAKQFGLKIVEPWPALVPLVLNEEDRKNYCGLAGVSAEVVAKYGRVEFRERMLITHRGLSGPAILQVSSYWEKGKPLTIDLAPGKDVTAELRASPSNRNLQAAKAAFRAVLPHRFADRWVELHQPARWNNAGLEPLEREAHAWKVMPAGTEGYEKAEVTAGGVDTDELSAKTMEARKVPGLHFIGEVVDVTGWLGGYNFQWAWASGVAAGNSC